MSMLLTNYHHDTPYHHDTNIPSGALIVHRKLSVDAYLAALRIAAGASWGTRLAVSKLSEVASKSTVAVVAGKEYTLSVSTGKPHRSHLTAGLSRVAGRTEALSVETHSVAVTLLRTALNCTGPLEGIWTKQVPRVAWNSDVLTWKETEGVLGAHLDCKGFSGQTADSRVAAKLVLSLRLSLKDETATEAPRKLAAFLSSGPDYKFVQTFCGEVGIRAHVICVELYEETVRQGLVFAVSERSLIVVADLLGLSGAVFVGRTVTRLQNAASLPKAPVDELSVGLSDFFIPTCFLQKGKSQEGYRRIANENSRSHKLVVGSLVGPVRHCRPLTSSRLQEHPWSSLAAILISDGLLDEGAVDEGALRSGDHLSSQKVAIKNAAEPQKMGRFVDSYFDIHLERKEIEAEVVNVPMKYSPHWLSARH